MTTNAMTTDTAAASAPTPKRGLFPQLARDLGYLLPNLPIAIVSFSVLITLLSTAAGTPVIWVGVPLAVAMLWVVRWFADVERLRLHSLGRGDSDGHYKPAVPGTWW
jgi:hypothetical protein